MFKVLALPKKDTKGKEEQAGRHRVSGLSRQNESGSILLREDRRKFLPVAQLGQR